ncbi:hypothetical protein PSTG_01842 [Puccinia striiformis f. sp. tritici PST-78]|uniref:C2H2-type domain-containing protein n=1 Tax=Puccinia striiformis f. sp. tritici PST-78 TaxID=1165861 RepID=A0A0L0W135_9BASI|nr:hypothetical protein PSTG_01842 [Puccinia striiformis f. sp. tritici PST-78]
MDLLSSLESVIAMASTAASSSVDAAAAAAAANRGAVDIPVSNFPFDPSLFSNNSTTTITPPTSSHDTQKNKRNRTRKRNNDNSNNNNQLIIPNHTQIDTSQVSSELIEQSLSPFRVGKNWACRICGREFTRRFNCTTHERTHLDLKERAQFQCRLCPRPFTRRHDLERHIHSVHPGHPIQRETEDLNSMPLIVNHHHHQHQQPQSDFDLHHRSSNDNIIQSSLIDSRLHSDHLQILDQNNTTSHLEPLLLMNEPAAATTTTTMCTTTNQARSNTTATMVLSDQTNPPTAILTSGSIRGISQGIERVPIEQIQDYNPGMEIIFKFDKKWACGTCGRIFVRRNNCKAHEATHRDIREHQCSTCSRSFSRKHDLERHMSAVHPGVEYSDDGRGYDLELHHDHEEEEEEEEEDEDEEDEDDDHTSNQRKRRKQGTSSSGSSSGSSGSSGSGSGSDEVRTDEWTAIDPFILSLEDPSKSSALVTTTETTKTKTRKGKGTKRLKLTSTQSRVLPPQTHASPPRSSRMGSSSHPTPLPTKAPSRSTTTSSRVGQPVDRRNKAPVPPTTTTTATTSHDFNIFETFDRVDDSSSQLFSNNPIPSSIDLNLNTISSSSNSSGSGSGSDDLDLLSQLDPRLLC